MSTPWPCSEGVVAPEGTWHPDGPQCHAVLGDTQCPGTPCGPEGDLAPLALRDPQGPPASRGTQRPPASPVPRVIWGCPAPLSYKGFLETPQHPPAPRGTQGPLAPKGPPHTPQLQGVPRDPQHPRDPPHHPSPRGTQGPSVPKGPPHTPQLQRVPTDPQHPRASSTQSHPVPPSTWRPQGPPAPRGIVCPAALAGRRAGRDGQWGCDPHPGVGD